jgi:mRNA-degrading endonuclease toxin of MazEF toxin-antitoxin module
MMGDATSGTVAGGKAYEGEPRHVLIMQDDSFDATDSVTICVFTTDETDASSSGPLVAPDERNGLRVACRSTASKKSCDGVTHAPSTLRCGSKWRPAATPAS